MRAGDVRKFHERIRIECELNITVAYARLGVLIHIHFLLTLFELYNAPNPPVARSEHMGGFRNTSRHWLLFLHCKYYCRNSYGYVVRLLYNPTGTFVLVVRRTSRSTRLYSVLLVVRTYQYWY